MANRLAEKLIILRDHGNGLLLRIYNMKKDLTATNVGTNADDPTIFDLLNKPKTQLANFTQNVLATKKFSQLYSKAFGAKVLDEIFRLRQVVYLLGPLAQPVY